MLGNILTKVFGSKQARDMKKIQPLVDEINGYVEEYQTLTDEELQAKTKEFKRRYSESEMSEGETLNDLLPEAFAAVKETCRRLKGKTWMAGGSPVTWDMVPFDVQLAGGIALHRGEIAEMATGEGKTLVATMPLYLNALAGKGAHLVTVNDYLAKRDAEWMGEIYKFLGLTVGCIITDMEPEVRRQQYACDITYGTNNEFGFDYLRDNMSISKDHLVQRGHYYAIIDEVDSVLIDEARTPLIISGPVEHSYQRFDKMKPYVESLVRNQTLLVNRLLSEAERLLELEPDNYEAGIKIFQAIKGAPKNSRLRKLLSDARNKKIVDRVELDFIRDKKMPQLEAELFYVIDEKGHNIDLTDKGRHCISPQNPDMFVLKDIVEGIQSIDARTDISEQEKEQLKQTFRAENDVKAEELHNISQLLRAYSLFDKDVDYVIQDNKVIIVDEFTGRLMPGRRYSDGLHQALEAKEGAKIERETQTFATITLQNYFRMYEKLAGMTGTAETESAEFAHTYKMDVVVVPTNKPIRRIDYNDVIYKTKREKYNAIIDEIEKLHNLKLPVLVGTVSVEVSELLSRMLRRKNISHSVLNAKYHDKEAEIIREAGKAGAVTIATNMAGRGTDIKLGAGVVKCKKCCIYCKDDCGASEECSQTGKKRAEYKKCYYEMQCGLQIVGTERHEARRIDRQLRGRSGRQGDPGASRFFISLEDDLMRLFGSDRISSVMARFGIGLKDGEEIQHPMITKSIGNAQKKIEMINFERRKHTLEYDNVMNKQREVIYSLRREILLGENIKDTILDISGLAIEEVFDEYCQADVKSDEWDIEGYLSWLKRNVLFIELNDITNKLEADDILNRVNDAVEKAYDKKETLFGKELINNIAQYVSLHTIDDAWREHLLVIDELQEGIGLRAYGQRDPLQEYQADAYDLFEELMEHIHKELFEKFFRVQIVTEKPRRGPAYDRLSFNMPILGESQFSAPMSARRSPETMGQGDDEGDGENGGRRPSPIQPFKRTVPKVGRNDACPCGSGKKYKKCCGRLSEQ